MGKSNQKAFQTVVDKLLISTPKETLRADFCITNKMFREGSGLSGDT